MWSSCGCFSSGPERRALSALVDDIGRPHGVRVEVSLIVLVMPSQG
jgi:hypothetical protein